MAQTARASVNRPYHIDRLIPIAVFISTATLYIRTAGPTLGGVFDSEEFQHVAYTLGIAHATGYPLYLLIGKIFITLVPISSVAYRMNLVTALLGAGAAMIVYFITMHLTQRRIASVATAALFATNSAVWRQSGVASVGPMTMLFMGAVVYACLLWHQRRVSLAFVAFVFGLSLTHHHSTLLFLPGIIFFILLEDFKVLRRPRELFRILIWFAIPLLIYLYVPIRWSVSEWYDNTVDSFFTEVFGLDAGDFLRTSLFELVQAATMVFNYLFSSFTPIGSILVLIGAVSVLPRLNRWHTTIGNSKVALFIGIGTCVFVGIGVLYGGEPDRYLSLPFFFVVIWFGIGAAFIQNLVARHRIRRAAAAVAIALPLVLTFNGNFRIADWSSFERVYKQWDEIFSLPIPQNATIVGNWGQLNAMRYIQYVEKRRPDIRPIGTLYDPEPQTFAAREAFEQKRAIFLAPSNALPIGNYRYSLLGPLLQVRDAPSTTDLNSLPVQKNLSISPSLILSSLGISTALETYAPSDSLSIMPTRSARVALNWRVEDSVKDFLTRIRIYDPESRLIAQRDELPVRGVYPPSQWQRGEIVNDVYNVLILGGTPPGNYNLKIILLDAETKTPISREIAVAPLTIPRATQISRADVFAQHSLDVELDRRLSLWGYGGLDGTHRPGEKMTLNLVWSVREDIAEELYINFSLLDSNGNSVKQWQRPPIAFYPTREWKKGEALKAYYDLDLPDGLASGELSLAIGLDRQKLMPIAKIQVAP